MTFITHEPIGSISEIERDSCDSDGCDQTDDLALVTSSDHTPEARGVFCPDCAAMLLFGGAA